MSRPLFVAVVAAFVSACHSSPSSPSVAPPSTTPPVGQVGLVSGTVWECTITGRQPLPGVGIDVSPEFQSWPPITTTDANGRFQASTMHGQARSEPC